MKNLIYQIMINFNIGIENFQKLSLLVECYGGLKLILLGAMGDNMSYKLLALKRNFVTDSYNVVKKY